MPDNQYYNPYSNNNVNFNNTVFIPPISPEDEEKKKIRKIAFLTALSCMMMFGITFFWSVLFSYILKIFGFSYKEAINILKDPFVMQMAQVVLSSLMFTIPYTIIFKVAGYSVSKTVPLSKPEKKTALLFILIGVGCCSFANIAVSIAGGIFESMGFDYNVDFGENPNGILGFIISFIATAIIPALVEEFAFRGFIMGTLRKFGDTFAIITSSIIFGLMHGNFQQIPFAFIVGLALAFITVKSGSLWLACLVHSINNSISVFVEYLLDNLPNETQNLVYNVYLALALLAGVIGFLILSAREKGAFKLEKAETKLSETQKYKSFFSSAWIIIFIIVCLAQSLMFVFY